MPACWFVHTYPRDILCVAVCYLITLSPRICSWEEEGRIVDFNGSVKQNAVQLRSQHRLHLRRETEARGKGRTWHGYEIPVLILDSLELAHPELEYEIDGLLHPSCPAPIH